VLILDRKERYGSAKESGQEKGQKVGC
jgi:hypothetical protein